ncbi:hypothetical protein FPV67DRAFT_1472930 [Lyophyllum atratum]|nr:hypothetical protein FPV67DRAFT_1472930 [Lyophyllum atratum]
MASEKSPAIQILPVEILIYIFRLSTKVPRSLRLGDPNYWPFRNIVGLRAGLFPQARENIWATKLALPLVCRSWRELSFGITYEEIHAGGHVESLLKAFEESETTFPGNGFGRQVRHLVLDFWNSTPVPLSIILRWCPNVTYIAKDDIDTSPTPTADVDLACIKRFDWVLKRIPGQGLENTSHGRDFYRDIVARASNLQYLHVAISYPTSRLSHLPSPPITAHSLTTLHVQHIGNVLRQELEMWQFPNLTHLITDSSLTWNTFSPLFGPRLELIGFLRDEALYDASLDVLAQCPNIRELNYYIEFASFSRPPLRHDELECIRLHSGKNHMLDEALHGLIVERQFFIFAGAFFPSLKRIILHGDWDAVIPPYAFFPLCGQLRRRNCSIEDEHGTPFPPKV